MTISTTHPAYDAELPRWQRCRDLFEGQDQVKLKGDKYLPKLMGQDQESYDRYKKRAVFYNAFGRTITGLHGMIFRKPPNVVLPAPVKEMSEDITLTGVDLGVFVQQMTEEILISARYGVLIDYPKTEAKTLADTQRLGDRPNLCGYIAEQIINWRTRRVGSKTVLSMVILAEQVEQIDEKNPYKTNIVTQYRKLELTESNVYEVSVWECQNGKDVLIEDPYQPQMAGKPLDFIPFFICGTNDTTPDVESPPMLDLADMNVAHYCVSADYEHGCHFTGLPTPVITGYTQMPEDGPITLGSESAICLPNPQSGAHFLEFQGSGLTYLENNLASKERMMAVLGARMLEQQKKGVETAEVASIHRAGEQSILATIAQTISTVMEDALEIFSQWAGSEGKVKYDLNRDFHPLPLDANGLTALVKAWQSGAISYDSLFNKLKTGEVISEEVTLEEERTKIDSQPPVLAGGMGNMTGNPQEPGADPTASEV